MEPIVVFYPGKNGFKDLACHGSIFSFTNLLRELQVLKLTPPLNNFFSFMHVISPYSYYMLNTSVNFNQSPLRTCTKDNHCSRLAVCPQWLKQLESTI